MKLLVGSLQYSPIYKSHCCALGKQAEKLGLKVRYFFSNNYKWMLSEDIKKKSYFVGNSNDLKSILLDGISIPNRKKLKKISKEFKPDYIYMYNLHPLLNKYLAKLSNKIDCEFIQHVHEPFVKNKNFYGGFKKYWLWLFEYLQEKVLSNTEISVLSSEIAIKDFKKRYENFQGKIYKVPLIYEDLNGEINKFDREYITFMGPPAPAKNPEKFLEIVEYSEKNDLGYQFLIISHSKIEDSKYHNHSNLEVFYKPKITDEEIGDIFKKSLLTLTPYKVAKQSSVILTSYMYGTPVLSSKVGGLPEFVENGETGLLIDKDAPVEKWIKNIEHMIEENNELTDNCRKYFEDNFSEKNWPDYFDKIFETGEYH